MHSPAPPRVASSLSAIFSMIFFSPSVLSAAPAPVQIGGYVNPELSYSTFDGAPPAGLNRVEGAVYLGASDAGVEAKLDLPLTLTAGKNFAVGIDKAQAYVAQKLDGGFRWKVGQWDTTFGYELNDSVDVFFSQQGLVFSVNPVVHTGLLLGYDFNPELSLNVYAATPADSGPVAHGVDPQFGAQVVYVGAFRAAAGALKMPDNLYADVVIGKDFGDLALDAEYNVTRVPKHDAQMGYLLHATYAVNPTVKAGVRAELLSRSSSAYRTVGATVGPHIKLTGAAVLKVNYQFTQVTVTEGDDAEIGHAAFVDAVYRF